MLQFITGRSGSGKSEYIIKQLAMHNGDKNKLLLIVPEQYSFESEKEILHNAGVKKANSIQVLSFTRLADLVFRTAGGVAGRRLSDGGRRVIMEMAVNACQDQFTVYSNAVKSGRLAEVMMNMANEMKLCRISGDMLIKASEAVENDSLSQKLLEIALIYNTYEAMIEKSYLDARDDLTRLAQQLENIKFFTGYKVFVDSFDGFTMQETEVLHQIMIQADNVIVSVCTDNLPDKGLGLFSQCNRTKTKLKRIAGNSGIRILPDIKLDAGHRFINPNLAVLEQNFFEPEKLGISENNDGITIYQGANTYSEAEYTAASIKNLVMKEGYRYRDISVICRNPEIYSSCLNVAMQKRGIPCFISMPCPVDAEPVMRLVLNALSAVLHGFQLESILEMLKTGMVGMTSGEISDLENYSSLWRMRGKEWEQPFERHPKGFGWQMEEDDYEVLSRLNELRERVIKPLVKLRKSIQAANGMEISKAVYDLLVSYGAEENLRKYCKQLEEAGEGILAEKQVRLWDLMMDILDQMAVILGGYDITAQQYEFLLREVVSGEDISEIPQVMDSVLFGTPEQVRQSKVKAVFILGAVQGKFPAIPKELGMLSDKERKYLISDLDLPLTDALQERSIEERYLSYSVVCRASEKLYVTYPLVQEGEDTLPSEIVDDIQKIFPGLEEIKNLPVDYFANSLESAFTAMSARFKENSSEAAALRICFADREEYSGRIEALKRASDMAVERITDGALLKNYFGRGMYISPSQAEAYYSCPFHYYCKYMLKAKENKTAQMDALQYGTLMHHLFERTFTAGKNEVLKLSDDDLRCRLDEEVKAYADLNMGGYEKLGSREQYRIKRMVKSGTLLVRHVSEELSQSKFEPRQVEMQLGYGEDFAPLRITTPQGNTVTVGGTIDRVDVYVNDNGVFVRVVDYKTGNKKFRLQEVLYGLNMQMIIYLAALVENKEFLPAGVLYTPLVSPAVTADYGTDKDILKKEAEKDLKMNGIVVSDTEIITAMEEAAQGRFIPVNLKKDGSVKKSESALSADELSDIIDYTKWLVGSMADSLAKGNIEASPMMKNKNSCAYCPYSSVCGREYGEADIEKSKMEKREVFEKMHERQGQ